MIMKLNLLLFGIVRDLLASSTMEIEVPNACTVHQLKTLLIAQYPILKNINSYAIAVNEAYANNETVLQENDVIAIIPPVSGG